MTLDLDVRSRIRLQDRDRTLERVLGSCRERRAVELEHVSNEGQQFAPCRTHQCGAGGGDCPDSGREKFTFAGVIGGGLRFGALGGLTVEGRYIYGLSDLNLTTVGTTSSYKTRSLLLLAGISF